jgi:hypothetical protein
VHIRKSGFAAPVSPRDFDAFQALGTGCAFGQ